jgi:hypothetical protein
MKSKCSYRILLLILLGYSGICMAQPNYPVAPPTTNLTGLEYFISASNPLVNVQPGSGTAIAIPSQPDVNNINSSINLGALPSGFYSIYLRSRNANGVWSLSNVNAFSYLVVPAYPNAPAAANVVQMEYAINANIPYGSGTPITITPGQNIANLNVAINLTGLPQAAHLLYIRSRDANGVWSLTNVVLFTNAIGPNYPSTPAAANIVQMEYVFNSNVPYGSGTPLPVTPGQNIASQSFAISTIGLPPGAHIFYIRSKDANGVWSLTNIVLFSNATAANYPSAPAPAPPVSDLEFFIDNDPGFGNGTPVTVPGNSGDVANYAVSLTLPGGLLAGPHLFYIRSRQNPWSHTMIVPFSIDVVTPVSWMYVRGQMSNRQSYITWGTATETNTRNFVVEHSTDGRNFIPIGTVAAAGNSNTAKHYQFVHTLPANGFNYYRIRQNDLNGDFTYSAIVNLLNRNGNNGLLLAPNPVRDMVQVALPEETQVNFVEVIDAGGRTALRKDIRASVWALSLQVQHLAPGRYVLRVHPQQGKPFVCDLIKQ